MNIKRIVYSLSIVVGIILTPTSTSSFSIESAPEYLVGGGTITIAIAVCAYHCVYRYASTLPSQIAAEIPKVASSLLYLGEGMIGSGIALYGLDYLRKQKITISLNNKETSTVA